MHRPKPVQGYVYAAPFDRELFAGKQVGDEVHIPVRNKPFWPVAYENLYDVPINGWGGRLWHATVIDEIIDTKLRLGSRPAVTNLPRYTRANAIRLEEEIPIARAFGTHGVAVCAVIERAHAVTLQQAEQLSAVRDVRALDIYLAVMERWRQRGATVMPAPGDPHGIAPIEAVNRTPIGAGCNVVGVAVMQRAGALKSNFYDEKTDSLYEPWEGAEPALREAALTFGAPELPTPEERDILARPWRRVFGSDPT